MSDWDDKAYSRRQWFWAVNLITLLGALAFTAPASISRPIQAMAILPYALIVAFMISWIFVAFPLSRAMSKPASWLRAGYWGACLGMAIALAGFILTHSQRLRNQRDDTFYSQLGGGDFVREVNGVLTPYGWWVIAKNNMLFIVMCIFVALVVRAVLGPGKSPS